MFFATQISTEPEVLRSTFLVYVLPAVSVTPDTTDVGSYVLAETANALPVVQLSAEDATVVPAPALLPVVWLTNAIVLG